uniref:Stonustoxin-like helical domain-containing protein n=1 Tax=Acanthochromis polyacanthus TaxID=80966 RepID=A0A3Q1EV59_9TELE
MSYLFLATFGVQCSNLLPGCIHIGVFLLILDVLQDLKSIPKITDKGGLHVVLDFVSLSFTGITLWDRDDLKKHLGERPQSHNDFEVVASESIEDKSSALNVNSSDFRSKNPPDQLQRPRRLMELLSFRRSLVRSHCDFMFRWCFYVLDRYLVEPSPLVKHQYITDEDLATHVVTGILYGAQAFFVFDREVSENENHQDIQGDMKAMIKKIPCLSIDGDELFKRTSKKVLRHLQMVSDGCNDPRLPLKAVPVKVWLLPLTSLDSSAAKLVCQISIRLVQEAQRVLEDFSELEMRSNDALRSPTVQQFPQIGEKMKDLKEMCSEFKLEFQRTLAKKLPSIRGGGEEEAELAEILKKRHSSPFNSKNLNCWMDCKGREISILKSFTKIMKNTKTISSEAGLDEELFSAKHAVSSVSCLVSNGQNHQRHAAHGGSSETEEKEQPQYWQQLVSLSSRGRSEIELLLPY